MLACGVRRPAHSGGVLADWVGGPAHRVGRVLRTESHGRRSPLGGQEVQLGHLVKSNGNACKTGF